MRFGKIFLLYPCYAGQAHRRVRTSLVRRMTNLIAKELHSILNNDKGNLNNNLNPCRFLFQGDLTELAYKCFSSSWGEVRPPLTAK